MFIYSRIYYFIIHMNPLLISGFGCFVSVDKRKLVVYNSLTKERKEFYPHQIEYDSIIIDCHSGAVSLDALKWIAKHGITLTVLNWDGNLLSSLQPKDPISGKLKIAQYRTYLDEKKRNRIASEIIRAKINKSYEMLSALSTYYGSLDMKTLGDAFHNEQKYARLDSVNNIMTYEGRVADIYWRALRKVFIELAPEFHFRQRKNKSYLRSMNASDEINAMLNYGYAVLETLVRKAINITGLDMQIGFLHEINNSKTPLVYDLQELYRWLVDLSVIQVLEDKKLKKSDFIVTENYNIRLRENAAKLLLNKIRLNFNKLYKYGKTNRTMEFTLLGNTRRLASYILGQAKAIQFEIPIVRIDRNDDLALRSKILSISPEERKKLGINKSTLWYQKKNIKEGKSIKLYYKNIK